MDVSHRSSKRSAGPSEGVLMLTEGTESVSLLMESRDIDECFTLFLGRAPDVAAVRRCSSLELGLVLRELIQGEEFRAASWPPYLVPRESLPQERIASAPSLRLIDWTQRRLSIGAAARTMAGAARSWIQLLEALLSDPYWAALSPDLATAGSIAYRERLETAAVEGQANSGRRYRRRVLCGSSWLGLESVRQGRAGHVGIVRGQSLRRCGYLRRVAARRAGGCRW